MTNSDQSLSIVLPVHNAQNQLTLLVSELLEVLPEVAPQFEVLIVDDGSTDQTIEVAQDIALFYPQIRVIRHHRRLGARAIIRSGYEHTTGKVVVIQPENTALTDADLRRLWQMRGDHGIVVTDEEASSRLRGADLSRHAAAPPAPKFFGRSSQLEDASPV